MAHCAGVGKPDGPGDRHPLKCRPQIEFLATGFIRRTVDLIQGSIADLLESLNVISTIFIWKRAATGRLRQ
jgi:hypothetical protein